MDNRIKSSTAARASRKPLVWWIAVFMTIPFTVQGQNKYVGAKKCATCHNTDKQGNPFQVWQTSTHAGAFRTLANVSAEKDARHGLWIVTMGRGDRYGLPTPANESKYCLPCHATAVGADAQLTAPSFDLKDGVQCESCHGPGSAHAEVETIKAKRKAIPADEVAAALEIAKAAVLKRYPNEKEIEAQCTTCHDGMCGDFNFAEMWPKIKHSAAKEH